ncbi:MAG: FAD-dependent oxidoreductase [Opitutales bacterium]
MQTIHEAARDVTVAGSYDVVIAGAGPSGIAAALASARTGASTLLLEGQGCLGGVWTAGLLSWIIDAGGKQGIMTELFEAIDSGGLRTVMQSDTYATAYDPEMMKRLLERLCLKAGIRIRLHTWLVSAELNDEGRLTHVVTESKSGPEAWAGRVLVDCTGDGDLAARAGCGFDFGHPGTGQTQPSSLLGLLGGPALEDVRPFLSGGSDGAFASENKRRLRELLTELGVAPSYASASLFPIHDGLYMFMANHEYGVKATDADDITRATLQARSEVHAMATALGRHDGPFSDARAWSRRRSR